MLLGSYCITDWLIQLAAYIGTITELIYERDREQYAKSQLGF